MPDLYQELINLADGDMYPFHMPGHKRNLESTPLKGAFRCDITEIDGFDNLHDEKGIILEAEKRANALYGAEETFFLVNGSTCGVLSAVSAAVREGGRILAARGSHRAFYHAAYLRRLTINYLKPKMIENYGIYDSYNEADIIEAIGASSEKPEAVFITSPTYEGKCSDIEGIARACHRHGIILIVDAAHGAHLGFDERLPKSAVQQGADIVIHSLHKTLPSMTQTALIHVQNDLVDRGRLKRFLRIYQTSSPSYVMMASMDLCMTELRERGKDYFDRLIKFRNMIEDGTRGCKKLSVFSRDILEDPSKVLIYSRTCEMTGPQLYDILREDYLLQPEMAGDGYALAIITGWDTEDGIKRLIDAICSIDKSLADTGSSDYFSRDDFDLPIRRMELYDAWDADKEILDIKAAKGRISGDFINLYPPGIPIIVPGEELSKTIIEKIEEYLKNNRNVQGILDGENTDNKGIIDKKGIICVKQR